MRDVLSSPVLAVPSLFLSSKTNKQTKQNVCFGFLSTAVENGDGKPRSSQYRGVTKHKRSGRWEAHIWVRVYNRLCLKLVCFLTLSSCDFLNAGERDGEADVLGV